MELVTTQELTHLLIALRVIIDELNAMPLLGMMSAVVERSVTDDDVDFQHAAEVLAMTIAYLNEVVTIGRELART